jgi:transcriptional regulator GlxA family with amidase domain
MGSGTEQRYQAIVFKVEDIAHRRTGETLHIKFLCIACGVGQRTLRNAFRSIHGKTPYRHLCDLRMQEAREALLHPGSSTVTVTAVAMQFGFLELGRFSVAYRSTFGECPSATLRRSHEHSDGIARRDGSACKSSVNRAAAGGGSTQSLVQISA